MFELLDGRASAFQWDTGLYVDCTGLKETDEVHFCRPGQVLAIHPAMQGETLAAPVPDELLQRAAQIRILAYTTTNTGETTTYEGRLGVFSRPKPPGYVYTPAEVLSFKTLEERITKLEESGGGSGSSQNAGYKIKGLHVVFFGDSICFGAGSTGGYAKSIQEITECIANNQGQSGASVANAGSSTYKIVNIVKEFTGTADMIVIEGGANDYNQGVALGEITKTYIDELDTTTFCGALESIIQTLIANYPAAKLFGVFMHRAVSDTVTNANGVTMKEFHDKAISIYDKYAIPYYDAYKDSGLITAYSSATGLPAFFKKLADTYTYNGDKVHPNANGYEKYYVPQIIDMLERHCPIGEIIPDTGDDTTVTMTADMNVVGFTRSNGTFSTAADGRRTDYISMDGVQSITVKVGGFNSASPVSFYDANKVWLGDISLQWEYPSGLSYGWYEKTIDTTGSAYSAAKYFVITSYHTSLADSVYNGDNDFSYDSASYTRAE